MSFDEWLANDRVRKHVPSRDEVSNLLSAAGRNAVDATAAGLSVDRQFMLAYESALGLGMAAFAAAGYRTRSAGHHAIVIAALPLLLGTELSRTADYLDDCRKLRHVLAYERVGLARQPEVERLLEVGRELRQRVLAWLAEEHPELLPEIESE